MEKGYDRVVAVSTSLLQDVPTPTDQVPFLVVPHTQCPRPAVAPLFSHPNRHQQVTTRPKGTGGGFRDGRSHGVRRHRQTRREEEGGVVDVVVVVGGFGGHGAIHA